jgi:molybdopterin-guanine dinucleotide biosynthesis protein A
VVLAGGASRRMGREKATLRLAAAHDETLLERAARHLVEAGATTVSVATGTAGRLGPLPWPEVDDGDGYRQAGPLAGMAAGLASAAAAGTSLALVLAVDLADADPVLLAWLATTLAAHDPRTGPAAVVPLDPEGRPQPLHAAYRPARAAAAITHLLDQGQRRVLAALDALEAELVTPDARWERPWFRNRNTPADLE